MSTALTLEEALRRALNHLYDSVALRRSPLADVLRLRDRPNPSEALRSLLETEIQLLSNATDAPANSRNHRYYQVLYYRYIQRFMQHEVAAQLGIGTRHLRREQDAAIRYLAERVRDRHGLPADAPMEAPAVTETTFLSSYGDIDSEIERLIDTTERRSCELEAVLDECIPLVQSLAAQRRVQVLPHLNGAVTTAVAFPVLKQVMLNLLVMAIRALEDGIIWVRANASDNQAVLSLIPQPSPRHRMPPIVWDEHTLSITQRMARAFRGQVEARSADGAAMLALTIPLADRVRVLAIEDNQDTLDLWQRYLRDSPFHLIPLHNPHEVLSELERLQPDLIVLDIMMPEVDGWELLSRLREHRLGKSLPVVVCSVLPQRDLALSLGANGFLPKPATREQFLGVLQHLYAVAAHR